MVKAVSLLKDASNGDVERQDNITRKVFNVLSPNEKELSFLRNEFYSMVSHFCFATKLLRQRFLSHAVAATLKAVLATRPKYVVPLFLSGQSGQAYPTAMILLPR